MWFCMKVAASKSGFSPQLNHTWPVQEHFPLFFCPSFVKLWGKTCASLIFCCMPLLEKSSNSQKCFTSLSKAINALCLSEEAFTGVWPYWWGSSSTMQAGSPSFIRSCGKRPHLLPSSGCAETAAPHPGVRGAGGSWGLSLNTNTTEKPSPAAFSRKLWETIC